MALFAAFGNIGGAELVVAAIVAMAYGLLLVGMGQVFGALREIALNTRAALPAGSRVGSGGYVGLRFIALVLAAFGVIIILAAAIVFLGGITGVAST
jgi:hypothetical protein